MAKALILYFSQGGHTKDLADRMEFGSTIRIEPWCIKCMECERICSQGAIKINWTLIEKILHFTQVKTRKI